MAHQNCRVHPSFKSKPVYELRCCQCEHCACVRGMKALLLADRNLELYSTDLPPPGAVKFVGEDYATCNCDCRIRDVACSLCGCVVGYHVSLPCQSCLTSCNNGHFWMFHSSAVTALERLDATGDQILVWADLPSCNNDWSMTKAKGYAPSQRWVECCR